MRALLGVSCLLALMGNDPAMSPGPVKSAASLARMSEAISGDSHAKLLPFIAFERGYIDDVIMPQATRPRIARALAMLRGKTVEMPGRKHDNLPV